MKAAGLLWMLLTVGQTVTAPPVVWSEHSIDLPARRVRFYVARDDRPKPVVFLLQGSGCGPSFTAGDDGALRPTSLFQDVVATERRRAHFVIIEKPGVGPLRFPPGMTQDGKERMFDDASVNCTEEFLEHATKTARVDDVRAVMSALAGQSWVSGFILAGHSEGTHVTTGVLAKGPAERVIAAGLFASAGPSPFWSGHASKGGTRASFEETFQRVRALQKAEGGSMYLGLPARRWTTFWIESTPLDDVRDSTVPLFVAHGTRDGSILAPDLFVLEAVARRPARPVRYVVVEDGDHAFSTGDGTNRIPSLFGDFLDWALDPQRVTSTAVVR